MFDLKAIRENPEAFDAAWARRGLEPQTPTILEKDMLIRKVKTMVQEAEAARNAASKQIGAAMREGKKDEAEKLKKEGCAPEGSAAHTLLAAARPWSTATHALFPAAARQLGERGAARGGAAPRYRGRV